MSELSSNQYVLEEVFAASACEVFQHLTRLGSVYSLDAYSPQVLSPATTPCTALSGAFGVGFTWSEHRRHLFLRDLTQLEVVHCEAPAALTVVSNDGEPVLASLYDLPYYPLQVHIPTCNNCERCRLQPIEV